MLVLKILAYFAGFASVVALIIGFNRHCDNKFGYRFFSIMAFIILMLASGCLMAGHYWYESAMHHHGDTLNGMIIMAIGILAAAVQIFWNYRETNVLYGTGGTAVQFGLFGGLTFIAWPLLLLVLVLSFLCGFGAKPVFVN